MAAVSLSPSPLPGPVHLAGTGSAPSSGTGGSFSDALDAARQAPSSPSVPPAGPASTAPVPKPSTSGPAEPAAPARADAAPPSTPRETEGDADADGPRDDAEVAEATEAAEVAEDALRWWPWAPATGLDPATAHPSSDPDPEAGAGPEDAAGPALATSSRAGTGARAGLPLADLTRDSEANTRLANAGEASGAAGDDLAGGGSQPRSGQEATARTFGAVLAGATGGDPAAAVAPPAPTVTGLAATGLPSTGIDGPPRQVAAHVHSPAFAPALGAQLNLMVRDGVTEARLHLNPAEMGPISVQIRVVGQSARVEMVAEQAATRQALEQAMPVLAGALRDSGLTLSGGGVFEQRDPRQTGPQDGEGRSQRGGQTGGTHRQGSDDPAGSPPLRPVAVPRGVVDLYA